MSDAIDRDRHECYCKAYNHGINYSQLTIGFDISDNGDHSCMTVFQKGHRPGELVHVGAFWDEEALALYEKLGGRQVLCGKEKRELLDELASDLDDTPVHASYRNNSTQLARFTRTQVSHCI